MAEITFFSPYREKNYNKVNEDKPRVLRCWGLGTSANRGWAQGRPGGGSARSLFPPTRALSGGIVGTHELLLTVGAPCYKSSLVPRALWAAEHRAEASVFVLLLATRSEFLRNGKAPAPVCRQ